MRFSYNWLQDYIPKKLPKPEKLAELLTLHSFEVKEIEKKGKDYILDIDVLPNRVPDCASHIGIAREIAAIMGYELRVKSYEPREDKKLKAKDFVQVQVKNKGLCLRYSARVAADVKVKPSPRWLRERLEACGLQPINNIVDIANYVMLETGQPLHAFDFEKIESVNPKSEYQTSRRFAPPCNYFVIKRNSKQIQISKSKFQNTLKKIIVRRAKKGEKITTLDNKTYNLDEDILVIADGRKPIAIAGIKGGKGSEIDENTKTIVLESANFEPSVIRRASKKLKLRTDASLRFEHGLDPNLTESAINLAAFFVQKEAKGRVARGLVDIYPKKILPKKINLDLNYVEGLLGVKIPEKEIKDILKNLGLCFKIKTPSPFMLQSMKGGEKGEERGKRGRGGLLEVEIPTIRKDIQIPEDLIEEIGRLWGFEKIPAVFPAALFIPPKRNEKVFWRNFTRDVLKEMGFTEGYNYSFISEDLAKIFGYNVPSSTLSTRPNLVGKPTRLGLVELKNPISAEQKYLRPSLIPNLLKNVKENVKFLEEKEIKIFEVGKVFQKKEGEKEMLTGLIFQKGSKGQGFYRLKGIAETLLNKMGISDVWYDDYRVTPEEALEHVWHKKKSAEIKVGSEGIGYLGEASKRVLHSYGIEGRVFLFDLNFEKLSLLSCKEQEYRPLSPYPSAVRDVALLVPRETKVAEALNVINRAGGKLVRDVDLFDIYAGEELPQGKKNFAFHIIYQADDHALSSEEIDKIHNKIVEALEEKRWQVRR